MWQMVFDAFMEVMSIRRHWPWWSVWGRKLLNSLVSLTKLPSSHQGLLFYLLYLSSLEFWHWFSVHHMSPSSSMRIQLPAATAKCNGVSFIWENGGSVKGVFYPQENCSPAQHVFSASADGRMTGEKTPWSGLVSGAVLASCKSCSVLPVSA